ncbi:MAG: hypothetical protein AABX85_01850 [Nanoarchaeota archaeon]
MSNKIEDRYYFASFLLRIGLAIVFLYAGIAAFLSPDGWVGFVPGFVSNVISPYYFLHIHSIFNILLALWLISNKKVFYASIISSCALIAIILFNYTALDIVFRDISILFAAIALSVISYKK